MMCSVNGSVFLLSAPRQCTVCGKLAEFECKDCFGEFGVGLESIAFCAKCLERVSLVDIVVSQFYISHTVEYSEFI
jgi:ubiquitin thioesterase CYLD